MRRAGVNLVTVGVFAWSALEPAPGPVRLRLARPGAGPARAATASGSRWPPRPPRRRPGSPWPTPRPCRSPPTASGSATAAGTRTARARPPTGTASRGHRRRARRALRAATRRSRCGTCTTSTAPTCHCDLTAAAFRAWLRDRYGDLDALNEAWTTAFWSQRYGDWAQILPPRATQYLPNPAQVLDFRRFLSDELLRHTSSSATCCGPPTPDVPVTTNFVLGGWVPVDHARWAARGRPGRDRPLPVRPGRRRRGAGRVRRRTWPGAGPGTAPAAGWLLMETAPNLIYTADRMHTKEPGRMARHSLTAVARGSRGCDVLPVAGRRAAAPSCSTPRWCRTPARTPGSSARRWRSGEQLAPDRRDGRGVVAARVAIAYDEPSLVGAAGARAAVDTARPPRRGAAGAPGAVAGAASSPTSSAAFASCSAYKMMVSRRTI